MSLVSTGKGGSGFEPVPVGTYVARCVSVVDMGEQQTNFGKVQPKVYLGFEVPAVRVEWEKDGKQMTGPALLGGTYTNSIHPKSNLGGLLASWRGKAFTEEQLNQGFDLSKLLDVPCMISVVHNESGGKTYANISAIMGVMAGVEVPARETDLLLYSPSNPETAANYDKLPNWLKQKCDTGQKPESGAREQARAAAGLPQGGPTADDYDFDDDIPF